MRAWTIIGLAIVSALSAGGASAQAQDRANDTVVWSTELGPVAYVSEDGPVGVFHYALSFDRGDGFMFIDGLAGEFGGPGPLDGYWSEPDAAQDGAGDESRPCPFAILDGEGRSTRRWGRLRIIFTDTDFPGDWVMQRGDCFAEPVEVLTAKLPR